MRPAPNHINDVRYRATKIANRTQFTNKSASIRTTRGFGYRPEQNAYNVAE